MANCNDTYLQGKVAVIEAIIDAYEAAILAFATNGAIQTYRLDTGQSVQTVTRGEVSSMKNVLNSYYNMRAVLLARLGSPCNRPNIYRPVW